MSTGARGINAPEMTSLDAARFLLAVLTTPSPAQCVERVHRFGQLKYRPDLRSGYVNYEVIQPQEFDEIFKGETLEEVLSGIFEIPQKVGIAEACKWFSKNVFHLRITDFDILAELFTWDMKDGKIVRERVVPFKGQARFIDENGNIKNTEGWTFITGGIRTQRSVVASHFLEIGLGLMRNTEKK